MEFTNNLWYNLFVICIIMPINGWLIGRGGWYIVIGIILILLQIPHFYILLGG